MTAGNITIRHLRGISHLSFDVPKRGCYLLTGANGAGKTTLLVALHRIGYNLSFRYNFPASTHSNNLIDVYSDASITYQVGARKVRYDYGGARWVPHPKRNASVLGDFGLKQVIFVRADSQRIEPNQRELSDRSPTIASKEFRDALEAIFEDNRFDNLVTMSTGRGRSRPAYLVRERPRGHRYFSEKHFSTGEICVIRLVEQILHAKSGSAVLVDELEMALHPRVQVRLFEYLKATAKEKNLLVLLSTHSTSMIRTARPDDIIYLERDSIDPGTVKCAHPCYPAKASLGIAYDTETSPDHVFFVEDTRARALLLELIERYKRANGSNGSTPLCKILPIGGWPQVLEFHFSSISYLFPDSTKTWSFLDHDANDSIKQQSQRNNYSARRLSHLMDKIGKSVRYLPITPESGFVAYLDDNKYSFAKKLDHAFGDLVSVAKMTETSEYSSLTKPKEQFSHLVDSLAQKLNIPEENVERRLFATLVTEMFPDSEVFSLMGPIFNK